MSAASAARPMRERERSQTARRRSRATLHKRSGEHSARSERIEARSRRLRGQSPRRLLPRKRRGQRGDSLSKVQFGFENDLKSALKGGDKRKVATLRLLIAALKNERIQAGRELTEPEVEAAVRRAVKQRKDSIEQYEKGGRMDLVEAEKAELQILESYLPQGMSDQELEAAVRAIVAEKGFTNARDVGPLMKEVMARHRGRVDGKRAQEIARQLLP